VLYNHKQSVKNLSKDKEQGHEWFYLIMLNQRVVVAIAVRCSELRCVTLRNPSVLMETTRNKLLVVIHTSRARPVPRLATLQSLPLVVTMTTENNKTASSFRQPLSTRCSRFQLDTYGRRTFAVAGPTTWNLFQNNLCAPDMEIDCFRRTLKTFFISTRHIERIKVVFATMRYIN